MVTVLVLVFVVGVPVMVLVAAMLAGNTDTAVRICKTTTSNAKSRAEIEVDNIVNR